MQPINRVCFEVLKDKNALQSSFDTLIDRTLDWLKRRPVVNDPGAVLDLTETTSELEVGDNVRVQSINITEGAKRGWGLRYSHPDHQYPGLFWVGEVTLYDDGGGRIFYQNNLGVLHKGEAVSPYEIMRSNPSLNRDILREFKCFTKHGHRLIAYPHGLASRENSIELLTTILNDDRRSHPLVYVSSAEKGSPVQDVAKIARFLAGMAHVVVAEDLDLAKAVAESMPAGLACPLGGIRIYWPDFRTNRKEQYHRAYANWEVMKLGDECPNHLVDLIAQQAVLRSPDGYMDWTDLQTWNYRIQIASGQGNEDALQMLQMFEEENRTQQQALLAANKEITRLLGILKNISLRVNGLNSLLIDAQQEESPEIATQAEANTKPIHQEDLESKFDPSEIKQLDEDDDVILEESPSNPILEEDDDDVEQLNELGRFDQTTYYHSIYAKELYLQNKLNPKGVSGPSDKMQKQERPDYFKIQGGLLVRSGDWLEDSNYGYGRVMEINVSQTFSDASDAHVVWFYAAGKSLMMKNYQLRKYGIKLCREFQISPDVLEAFENFRQTEM
jgi:hypothetical protein